MPTLSSKELFLGIFTTVSLRYFVIAGLAFLVFYVMFGKRLRYTKIQPNFPGRSSYRREIFASLSTILIFTLIGFLVFGTPLRQYTQLYTQISEFGWPYLLLSILLMILLHDTYFYWTHRWMHHPRLFRLFHLTHHRSTNPSPWAAFAFHPLEAIVEASIIFLIAFLFPVHPLGIFVFLLWMMAYNVMGHLGWEIFPKGMDKHWFGQWFNTSTNHNMHHKYFRGNYGLYFTFWDKWMGTTHPKYHDTYAEVKSRKKEEKMRQPQEI